MLENITEVNKVRVEGATEDIELTLDNGKKIYSQAKSVVKASNDFTNVKQKLNDALESLADAYKIGDSKQLIYVTNSPNPFNDDSSKSAFYGPTKKSYDSLPDSCKYTIQSMTEQLSESIDLDQLVVRIIPFVKLPWINELQGNNCYRKDAVSATYRMNADASDRIGEEVNYAKM